PPQSRTARTGRAPQRGLAGCVSSCQVCGRRRLRGEGADHSLPRSRHRARGCIDRRPRLPPRRPRRPDTRRAPLPRPPGPARPLPDPARGRVKVLLVTMYFPPAGGGGVQRPLKFATHLPELGIETHVLAPDDPKWIHRDEELPAPTLAWVHRARYLGPAGRKPAEELHGTSGLERVQRQAALLGRRLLVPD